MRATTSTKLAVLTTTAQSAAAVSGNYPFRRTTGKCDRRFACERTLNCSHAQVSQTLVPHLNAQCTWHAACTKFLPREIRLCSVWYAPPRSGPGQDPSHHLLINRWAQTPCCLDPGYIRGRLAGSWMWGVGRACWL
eukprot:1148453-Pelagomonas_calceolata.AAC.5